MKLQESVTFFVVGKEQTLSKESRNNEVLVPKWLCSMTEALCHTHGGSDDDLVVDVIPKPLASRRLFTAAA